MTEFLQSDLFIEIVSYVLIALAGLGAQRWHKWRKLFFKLQTAIEETAKARMKDSPGGKNITSEELRNILLSLKSIPNEILKKG
jgi:hypothetical protein